MNKAIQDEWVRRLRSGEIQQGMGRLGRVNGERCCLGVLCDIAVEAGVIEPPVRANTTSFLVYAGEEGSLPEKVVDWAELPSGARGDQHRRVVVTMRGDVGKRLFSLTTLNDTGYSFEEIADIIDNGMKLEGEVKNEK